MTAGTQSIDRAAMLLDLVAGGYPDGVPFADILAKSGLTRPTARRVLQALIEHGFVDQDAESRRFFLGSRIYELGLLVLPAYDLQDICKPELERLVQVTGDTVFLNRVVGDKMTCIARESGAFPVKAFVLDVGVHRPIGLGAGGMAVLAALPPAKAEAILERNTGDLKEFSGGVAKIREMVELARETGYIDRVSDVGVRTVAMAIRDSAGTPFASISVSSIMARMTGEHLQSVLAIMEEEVAKISAKLSKMRPIGRA